jgi:hypothetical protein
MKDIKRILELNLALYKKYDIPIANLEEFVFGFKWAMAIDNNKKISFALRIGNEKPIAEYESIIRELIGKPLDQCIVKLLLKEDETLRTILVVLSNLMSKPLNTVELLKDRGIERSEGLNFKYDVKDMKVGLIGYGVYIRFFLNKCKEFHAFDLLPEKQILSYHISKDSTEVYPKNIYFHLGEDALRHKDVLKDLDIIIMSGSTLVNNSYLDILNACTNAKIKGIYGPSSELSPDYLFEAGYNYIFSMNAKDSKTYLDCSFAAIPNFETFEVMDLYELKKIN